MDRGVIQAVVLALGAGGVVVLQVVAVSALGRTIGLIQASMVSSAGTTLALVFLTVFAGGFGRVPSVPGPWPYAVGLLGAAYFVLSLAAVRELGAAGVTATLIAGQLVFAVVIDHFGLFGVAREAVSGARLLGIALLAGGVYLVVRP